MAYASLTQASIVFAPSSGRWIDKASKMKLGSCTNEPPQSSPAKNKNQTRIDQEAIPDWVPRATHSNHSQNSATHNTSCASLSTNLSQSQNSKDNCDSNQKLNCDVISAKVENDPPGSVVIVIWGDTKKSADIEEKEKSSCIKKLLMVSIFLTVATLVGAVVLAIVAILRGKEGNVAGATTNDSVQPMTFTPTQTPSSLIDTIGTQPPTQESTTLLTIGSIGTQPPTQESTTLLTIGSTGLQVSSPTETPTQSQTYLPTTKPLTGHPSLKPTTGTPTQSPTPELPTYPTQTPTRDPTRRTISPTQPSLASLAREYSVRHETIPTRFCGGNICEYSGRSGAFYYQALSGFWYDLDTVSHYIAKTQGSSHQLQAVWLDCMSCTLPGIGQLVRPTKVKLLAFAHSPSVIGEKGVTEGWVRVTEREIDGEISCSPVGCPDSMHNLWEL